MLIQYDIITEHDKKYFLIDRGKKYDKVIFINIIMESNNNYKSKISNAKLTKEVKQIMITEKCNTKFHIFYSK